MTKCDLPKSTNFFIDQFADKYGNDKIQLKFLELLS